MPLYRLALRKARESGGVGRFKWSTSFNFEATSATNAALLLLEAWVDVLRLTCRQSVYAYSIYATDVGLNGAPTPGTQDFTELPIPPGQQRGSITVSGGEGDWAWRDLCLNVEFQVPNSRPDRKYWRPGLLEADFGADGSFSNAAFAALVETRFNEANALVGFRTTDNEEVVSCDVTKAGLRRLGRQTGFEVPPPPPLG